MATHVGFIQSPNDLLKSLFEFNSKPEFYREVLSSSPKYFVHSVVRGRHIFGLSKFCVFKDIAVEEYVSEFRYKTNGGTAQNYISRKTNSSWVARSKVNTDVRIAFDRWITDFFPNYNLNNASFITIDNQKSSASYIRKISQNDLLEVLEKQKRIGVLGEKIAMKFEIDRLKKLGIKNPEVFHESVGNASAGYDIYSRHKSESRFIEVKASTQKGNFFYLTENEIKTLEKLKQKAYIYFVQIHDLKKNAGNVYKIIQDPISAINKNDSLIPVLYKVTI